MSSSDHSTMQQEPANPSGWMGDADLRIFDAVADMQERLAQFGRLVEQLREGLPEQQAGALGRIEQGIANLGERIAAFGREGQAQEGRGSLPPTAQADLDEPWDAQSAEALMRAHEMAEAALASSVQRPRVFARPEAAKATRAAATGHDQAWLDARFAEISALLQRSLTDGNPARSLAALDRRLDQFEQRLEAALDHMAACSGRDGLSLIEAHIKELAGHFEATCRQLARLDTVDGHLRELMQAVEDQRLQQNAGQAALTDDAIAALVDSAAERAVTRLAASGPLAGMASEAESQKRIDALEGLVQDYIAERRRGEDVTGGILDTIEGALTRIADRIDAIEVEHSGHASAADDDAQDRDGIELESYRLAEAYAIGARLLGREPLEPARDAASYAPSPDRAETEASALVDPYATAPPDAQTREELRASAMRAKIKAQATAQESASASAGLDQAKASMLKDRSATLSSITGSHRFSLLLGAAMALLCGTGFLVVDVFLTNAPPAGAKRVTYLPEGQVGPGAGSAQPTSEPGTPDPQLAVETPKSDRVPRADEQKAPAARPEPTPEQPEPETVTDDPGAEQLAPTRRLDRLRTGSTNAPTEATLVMFSQLGEPITNDIPAADADGPALPSAMDTAKLRSAAASGDALAQFKIARRFAEGKGVIQDHKQAFVWYERAAARGLALAQFCLAAYYERGVGTDPDRERARVWYRRAAEQGYAKAMHNLAVLSVGSGETQADYPAAAAWFRKAAERGLTDSQFNLGILYENGRGVPRDPQEAYKWYALAARSGDPVAARRLEQIKARMDQPGLDAAERKLTAWQPVPAAADPITSR